MASPEARQILIKDFGYQPVDIESKSGYFRAVKETIVKLENSKPNDPRISILQDAIRPSKKRTTKKESTKKESTKKESTQPKKTKDDAVKFIRGKGTPEPVEPTPPPIPKFGGAKTGAALTSISQTVNTIKKLVTRQNKFEKDKADDTREAREKKKRSMAENLMEGGKKMYDKVAGTFGKVLEPAKGIFSKIFDFLKLFILGSGLMMLLNWMGNPENSKKIQSIFRFLKDWWPVLVAGLMALFPGVALIPGLIALTVGFLPKLIDTVKMLFGFGKDVDKELAKNEKDLEKGGEGGEVNLDTKAGEGEKGEVKPEATPPTTGEETKGENLTEPQKFNKGGEVPGQGDTDTVPAMLTPGEFVLTKDAVKKYGTDTLYGMNAAAGGVDKSNDVPRGPSGKPIKKTMKKKSTVQTMMDMGGLNPINNISKSMNNVTNNTSNNISKPTSNVTNNINTSKSTSDVTNNSLSDMTNNISKSNVTNNIAETMNMSGGGMTKNMSYMGGGGMTKNTTYMSDGGMTKNTSYMSDGGMTKNMSYMNSGGMVTNNIGGTSNVQYMKLGGMVKNFISNSPQARFLKFAGNQISKTPQARLLRFAAKQIKKLPVKPPAAKALKALKALGMKNTPPSPMTSEGGDSSVNEIPRFSVIASGGRAKEQTLGIRR
jgi:hypothetical protein